MFYCDKCRKKNNWPAPVSSSVGNCEVCGIPAACYDVPSSQLPKPAPSPGLHLTTSKGGNHNAAIEIRDPDGALRCDIYVEIQDNRVTLYLADDIKDRDSDEVNFTKELMQREPDKDRVAAT